MLKKGVRITSVFVRGLFSGFFLRKSASVGEGSLLSLGEWQNYMVSSIPKYPLRAAERVSIKEFEILAGNSVVGLKCLNCDHLGFMPEHCAMFRCPKCKMEMFIIGKNIYFWPLVL